MKTKKTFAAGITVFAIMIFTSGFLFAQDTIFKKSKEQIIGKVTEIGVNEIKYKMENNPDGPVIVIRKEEVWKIKYENGTEMLITEDKYSAVPERAILDKTHAIKFELFSPLTGNITFCYEHMLKVGTNIEVKVGIIGPGFGDAADKSGGAFVKAGVKFLNGSSYVIDGIRYAHPLKGNYIKPELIFSSFTRYNWGYYYNNGSYDAVDLNCNAFAINIDFGKQWILGNTLTLDVYLGVGYGTASVKYKNLPAGMEDGAPKQDYYYSHLSFGKNFPLAISSGMTMGVIF